MFTNPRRNDGTIPVVLALMFLSVTSASNALAGGSPQIRFTNSALIHFPDGGTEPSIAIGSDGTLVLSTFPWLLPDLPDFHSFPGTLIYKGPFGTTPVEQGHINPSVDDHISFPDSDVDLGTTGTLHVSTHEGFLNSPGSFMNALNHAGVSVGTCPNADTSGNFAHCTSQLLDNSGVDRPWITSDSSRVYVAYHDTAGSLIHVQRSDDDGFTWQRVGDPIVGQGGATADATFNNFHGPIVADPKTHNVYIVYAAGEPVPGQKCCTSNFNNIFVARSMDLGFTWTSGLVFSAPVNTRLNNFFPALALDPVTGFLYVAWSDGHHVFVSRSSDMGTSWSLPLAVNVDPATTALFPWLAARNGTVDLVYYGTTAAGAGDPSAIWNAYMAQSTDGGVHWKQVVVSDHPNHLGVLCTLGDACAPIIDTRTLLDVFEVAIDPLNGKAAIVYVDDTLTTWTDSTGAVRPLPQTILAQQK